MMGFGFLSMFLVIALPIVGVVALIVWLSNTHKQGNLFGLNPPTEIQDQAESPDTKRYCLHCGTGLQDSWAHCPQCGAEIVPLQES
jgi:hypothetical protein